MLFIDFTSKPTRHINPFNICLIINFFFILLFLILLYSTVSPAVSLKKKKKKKKSCLVTASSYRLKINIGIVVETYHLSC